MQQALVIQGQEPLTASMLAAAAPQDQKQMLGERLFPLIQRMYPELAGKITGMLLEIDNSELLHMLEHHESLKAKVISRYSFKALHVVDCCSSRWMRLLLCFRLTRPSRSSPPSPRRTKRFILEKNTKKMAKLKKSTKLQSTNFRLKNNKKRVETQLLTFPILSHPCNQLFPFISFSHV